MQNLKILNKKEIKKILKIIKEQWGAELKEDYGFLVNKEGKVFIVNKDISKIDLSKLRINSLGLYLGTLQDNGFRLSIEGSQLIGPKAKKNVLELNEEQIKQWMKGIDFSIETNLKGFVLIKHKEDFLGCGRIKDNLLLNYVPKNRRVDFI